MLRIRERQLTPLRLAARAQFVASMVAHLRNHFPAELTGLADAEAQAKVDRVLTTLDILGIRDRRSACRILNLCAARGWDVLNQPANAWMRSEYLANPAIQPEQRVELLMDQIFFRDDVAAENARVRAAFERA